MSRPAIHPGEILAADLTDLGVRPTELARQLKVPANRISGGTRFYLGGEQTARVGWGT